MYALPKCKDPLIDLPLSENTAALQRAMEIF